jgi:nucleotide-binding universal stress UspA family protein
VPPTTFDDQHWVLEAALEHVRTVAPDLRVTSVIATGPASLALEKAAEEAETLVVGARGRGPVSAILLGSTSLHVVTHSPCPVVVVRGADDVAADAASDHVVVGFDGSHQSDDALAYAFAAASHRHRRLDVVIAWDTDELATYQLVPSIAQEVQAMVAHHRRELATAAAAPWALKYPDVRTRIEVVTEDPAQALIDRSSSAALVVVGSRGLGSLRSALLGFVSAQVLQHAHSPVAVIRPTTGRAAGPS